VIVIIMLIVLLPSYETNRLRQIQDGAPAERTENIPNGINLPHLAKVRESNEAIPFPLTICLIGRVVPIKDIKTFIRAMRTVVNQLPDSRSMDCRARRRRSRLCRRLS
jgi:glycosyltransferase involved in cell wall biosynthesis